LGITGVENTWLNVQLSASPLGQCSM